MPKEILTAEEVAKYLRVHPYTVKRLARAGKLPGFKVGGQWRFQKEAIDKLINNLNPKKRNTDLDGEYFMKL